MEFFLNCAIRRAYISLVTALVMNSYLKIFTFTKGIKTPQTCKGNCDPCAYIYQVTVHGARIAITVACLYILYTFGKKKIFQTEKSSTLKKRLI